jgi:hypothetical protein
VRFGRGFGFLFLVIDQTTTRRATLIGLSENATGGSFLKVSSA